MSKKYFTKGELSDVSYETMSYFDEIKQKYGQELDANVNATRCFRDISEIKFDNTGKDAKDTKSEKTVVEVVNMDTIDCAGKLIDQGLNPLVLNMASDYKPGGGWLNGSTAQEEELFRRSTYQMSMDNPNINKCYPLKGTSVIYSPGVIIFRDSRDNSYELYKWKECFKLNFIACPAIRNPSLIQNKVTKEYELTNADAKLTLDKMRMIFSVAKLYGHDSLVLGAMGNGAFHNPPTHTVKLFKQVIDEFNGTFKKVIFAVLTDKNDKYGNFQIYKKMMK